MRARLTALATLAALGGCRDDVDDTVRRRRAEVVQERARQTAPCPNQTCRELPRGLYGVMLGATPEAVTAVIGELAPRKTPVCSDELAAFEARAEIGGEAATCALDFLTNRLASIECALDGERTVDEHKAIGWSLYQTLARQYGNAGDLDDELMSGGRLSARWATRDRALILRLELQGARSIIRLANHTAQRRDRCASRDHTEVYERERMAKKARAFLRDLTGPLESDEGAL